jgi:hypothetical protein
VQPSLGTAASPPPALVFLHFALGAGFLLLACVAAGFGAAGAGGFYAQPRWLAVTHLLVLGWINLVAFGVLVQLVPVIFHAPLRWPGLAWAHLATYAAGAAGLAAAFWTGRLGTPLVAAGAVVWGGVLAVAVNLFATMASAEQRDASAWIIAGALVNLLATATLGVALAVNFTHPFLPRIHLDYLKLHAHLGFAGWLLGLIIGAGRRLLPMFLVAPEPPPRRSLAAFGAVEAGLLLWAAGLLLAPAPAGWVVPASAGLLALGAGLWLFDAALMFHRRARRTLDPALRTAGVALVVLALAVAAGLAVASRTRPAGPAVAAYGALVLFGAVSLLVQAFLYKIVPFLVWLHRWSPRVGRQPVPTLRDLVARAWIRTQLGLFGAGSGLLVAGLWAASALLLRIGAVVLGASVALLAVNFLRLGFAGPGGAPAALRPVAPAAEPTPAP